MQKDLKLSNNTSKLHQMFGPKLYSDRFSFISEMCQNAVDSHRRSKQTEPVTVGLRSISGGYEFYVKDQGSSFTDPEDFVNKICTLLESGKSSEKTNAEDCEMGEHGIGSISASAFSSEWVYDVVTSNKTQFSCKFRWIEGRGLTYEMSDLKPTTKSKEVKFFLNLTHLEINYLINAMTDKLCYFKDIKFEFDKTVMSLDRRLLTLNTTFEIFQSDDFQLSTLSKMNEVHICLDQYKYRIRWDLLGISPINLNIGLRFGLGDGLKADITRENLQVCDDYKEIVLKKIGLVADWMVTKYNSTILDEYTCIKKMHEDMNKPAVVNISTFNFGILYLYKYSSIKLKEHKFKDVSIDTVRTFINKTNVGGNLFRTVAEFKNGRKTTLYSTPYRQYHNHNYFMDREPSSKEALYLKNNGNISYLYKNVKLKLTGKGIPTLHSLLGLCSKERMREYYLKTGVNVWREPVKEFRILEESARKAYFINVSDIKIPSDFVLPPKKSRTIRGKEEMSMMKAFGSFYGHSQFKKSVRTKAELKALKHDIIYGDDKYKVSYAWGLCEKTSLECVILTKSEQKRISKFGLTNFVNVEDFLSGKHPEVTNIATSIVLSKFFEKESWLNPESINIIKEYVSKDIALDIQELVNHIAKYPVNSFIKDEHNPLLKAFMQAADTLKAYDKDIISKLNLIKEIIPSLDVVKLMGYYVKSINKDNAIKIIKDVTEMRRVRKEWGSYLT